MKSKLQDTRAIIWIGLFTAAMGAFVMLFAADIIHTDDAPYHAPRYIAFLAGLVFFSVGVFISLADARFAPFQKSLWYKLVLSLSGLTYPTAFVFIFNWVSFGPGEREFSSSVSNPFINLAFDHADEMIGRIIFAFPTLVMDSILLYFVGRSIYHALNKRLNTGDRQKTPPVKY